MAGSPGIKPKLKLMNEQ